MSPSSGLMMETVFSSETPVSTNDSTWRHNPEQHRQEVANNNNNNNNMQGSVVDIKSNIGGLQEEKKEFKHGMD
jgi:hypothetical protein